MIDPTELNAYADGELSQEQKEQVKRLLDSSPEAQAKLESIHSLKSALSNLSQPECSAEWRRCTERIQALQKTQKADTFVTRYGWAMACALFAFIFLGGVMNRNLPSQNMQSADLARAVASLTPAGTPRSQEPSDVRRFLDDLVGKASDSIRADQLKLVQGESGTLDGRRIARLHLRDSQGDLSLIVIGGVLDLDSFATLPDERFRAGQIQGVNLVAWSDGNNTMVLAGQRDYRDLVETALDKLLR